MSVYCVLAIAIAVQMKTYPARVPRMLDFLSFSSFAAEYVEAANVKINKLRK